jgi:hypothetical protein
MSSARSSGWKWRLPICARHLVELTWLPGQTGQDLQRAIRRGPWHVFHFIGHGGFDTISEEGFIAVANMDGETSRLRVAIWGGCLGITRRCAW